jgi:hypothetical protein
MRRRRKDVASNGGITTSVAPALPGMGLATLIGRAARNVVQMRRGDDLDSEASGVHVGIARYGYRYGGRRRRTDCSSRTDP